MVTSRGGFSATSPIPKQLQVPPPIMAAPKPIPTMIQQQQQTTAPRRLMAGGDHDQHLTSRRDRGDQSPSKMQYSRRPISDHQQHGLNNAPVNNIPIDRFVSPSLSAGGNRRQAYASNAAPKQPRIFMQEGDNPEMEMTFIQNEDMPLMQGSQVSASGNRFRQQPGSQQLRRGENFKNNLYFLIN